MRYYLAVDIGASSGRHILGHVEDGRIVLEEVYRFENRLVNQNGRLCWDLDALWEEVLHGLSACRMLGKIPETMGVDTWAVDFVLLDRAGNRMGDPVAYRDGRTDGMDRLVEEVISPRELYAKTGIQKQSFNTIYQLMALRREHPQLLEQADRLLMIPEYFNFRLTGKKENEYTNATSTGLVNAREKTWDEELLECLEYPARLFGKPRMPGTVLGGFLPEVRQRVGFDCTVVLPATHDTGSAFLAVPAKGENAVYLSSGTWSLLGVENREPITTEESRLQNFTNEGGYEYRFRYLKNIMGLWMIQSLRREQAQDGKKPSFAELEALAREAAEFPSRVDVNDGCFLAPESMTKAVKAACIRTGQQVPETLGQLMACVYQSLAQSYRDAVGALETLTGRTFAAVNIVGGGSKDGYLNELTAKAVGLPVYAGPSEGTALGNLMVQMIEGGEFPDLEAARRAERGSFAIREYQPK